MPSPELVSSAIVLSLLLEELSNDSWSLHNKSAVSVVVVVKTVRIS